MEDYLSFDVDIHSIDFTFEVIICNVVWLEETASVHSGLQVVNIHSTSCHLQAC